MNVITFLMAKSLVDLCCNEPYVVVNICITKLTSNSYSYKKLPQGKGLLPVTNKSFQIISDCTILNAYYF